MIRLMHQRQQQKACMALSCCNSAREAHLFTVLYELGDYGSSLRRENAILEASHVQAWYGDPRQQRAPVNLHTDVLVIGPKASESDVAAANQASVKGDTKALPGCGLP